MAWRGRANLYMARAGIDGHRMSEGMAKTYCILVACSIIPCLGIPIALVALVIYPFLIVDLDRMRDAIATAAGTDLKAKAGPLDEIA